MKYIKIENAKSGMILAFTLYDNKARMMLASNSSLTDKNINSIKKLGFKGIYVYDGNNPTMYQDMLSDNTRLSAIRNLKHLNIDSCLYVANSITNEILSNPDIICNLISVCSYDNLTYMHSINVAVFATMIAIDLGLDNEMLYKVTQAALLHDIGKTCIDENITKKESKLTADEYEEMKKHPYYGYQMIKNNSLISAVVKHAIYSHHENEDGSGYPRGVKGKDIHIVAKIIHAADVYDALTSKRSYKDEFAPSVALEYMQQNIGKMFDGKVVNAMLHCIAAYPIGTEVLLSNGETATIVEVNRHNILTPIVKTEKGVMLNLATEEDIQILKSLL